MFKKLIQISAVIIFAFVLVLFTLPATLSGIYTSADFPGWKFHFNNNGSLLSDHSGFYSIDRNGNTYVLCLEFPSDSYVSKEEFSYYIQNTDTSSIGLLPFSSYYVDGNGIDTSLELILLDGENGLKDPQGYFSASYMLDPSTKSQDIRVTFFKDGSFTVWETGRYEMAGSRITFSISGKDYTALADIRDHTFSLLQ